MFPATEEGAKEFWKMTHERFKFEHDFLIRRGWQPHERFDDDSGVSKWKSPAGEIASPNDAYDSMTMDYLKERGWRDVIEVERWGNAEWKKPIQQWERFQSPATKRIYGFLEAQHIMEIDWDESDWLAFSSPHTKMFNDLVGQNFEGTHIKTWFYLILDESHEKKGEVFCRWTMERYMIEGGVEILQKYDLPLVKPLSFEGTKHWTDINFRGGVSDVDRQKLYECAWHEVNGKWGYVDD